MSGRCAVLTFLGTCVSELDICRNMPFSYWNLCIFTAQSDVIYWCCLAISDSSWALTIRRTYTNQLKIFTDHFWGYVSGLSHEFETYRIAVSEFSLEGLKTSKPTTHYSVTTCTYKKIYKIPIQTFRLTHIKEIFSHGMMKAIKWGKWWSKIKISTSQDGRAQCRHR